VHSLCGAGGRERKYDGSKKHDVVAPHEEEPKILFGILLAHINALYGLLQYKIGCSTTEH
jgi:hypothetical protein